MNTRHPSNPNLTLHYHEFWNDTRVYIYRGPLIVEYLDKMYQVLSNAVDCHHRTTAIRFDLRLPDDDGEPVTALITRFAESLKSKIKMHERRKLKARVRAHPCHLRIIWAKERSLSNHWHYHVCIFLNRDTYFSLGKIKPRLQGCHLDSDIPDYRPRNKSRNNVNMADRIMDAWASALGIWSGSVGGLVHFPDNHTYQLDINDPDFYFQRADLFYRLSYLAKADTKHFGSGKHNFGCSRIVPQDW